MILSLRQRLLFIAVLTISVVIPLIRGRLYRLFDLVVYVSSLRHM